MFIEYFDYTRNELYSSIHKELVDTCDICLNQIHEYYCYENHLLKMNSILCKKYYIENF